MTDMIIQAPTLSVEDRSRLELAQLNAANAAANANKYAMLAGVDPTENAEESDETATVSASTFEIVKAGYAEGKWTLAWVKAAVFALWITPAQYEEIIGFALSAEEIAAAELIAAKAERTETVSKIVVSVPVTDEGGNVTYLKFDGDETSQNRMARTIVAAIALGADLATETRLWVLADNVVAYPTIKQIAQALKLAGDGQTEVWTKPYDTEDESTDETEDTGADTTVTE